AEVAWGVGRKSSPAVRLCLAIRSSARGVSEPRLSEEPRFAERDPNASELDPDGVGEAAGEGPCYLASPAPAQRQALVSAGLSSACDEKGSRRKKFPRPP